MQRTQHQKTFKIIAIGFLIATPFGWLSAETSNQVARHDALEQSDCLASIPK